MKSSEAFFGLKTIGLVIGIILLMSSCEKQERYSQGPRGYDGEVSFGVSYSFAMPYSYADNNPSIPNNPILGQYYHSYPGHYEFEYFINPYEYWHGSYDLWINAGGPGNEFGDAGPNGLDNYLMLICDPQGYYEERALGKSVLNNGSVVIIDNNKPIKIEMKLTNILERTPKLSVKFGINTSAVTQHNQK